MVHTPPACPQALAAADDAVEQAVALASELAPLLLEPDGAALCVDALAAFAAAHGLAQRSFAGVARRAVRLGAVVDAAAAGEVGSGGRGVGLCGAVDVPAAWRGEDVDPAALVLPSGLWSAVLAVVTAVAACAAGDRRVAAYVECPGDPGGDDDADAALLRELGQQHILVGGDGGTPFHDGSRSNLPITAARRSAMWCELRADAAEGASVDLAFGGGGPAHTLLAALQALPSFSSEPGPLMRSVAARYAQGLAPDRVAMIEELLAGRAEVQASALLTANDLSHIHALSRPTVTITRLEAGHRPDQMPTSARAIIDVRAPADRPADALLPQLREALPEGVTLRVLATRPPRMLDPDHPIYAAVARALVAARQPIGLVPQQARREPRGAHWEQVGAPVVGFAPAWLGLDVDAAAGLRAGALPVAPEGLRWGAALYVRVVLELAGVATVQG